MTYWITGGALILVAAIFWFRLAWVQRHVSKKAHADYALSRGTLHARQLHAGIAKTERALHPLIVERERIAAALDTLARTELKQLRKALASALIDTLLPDIYGVGARLKDRIAEACFDGTLESLNDVHHVPGVGADTALAIQTWVHGLQNRMPQLLKDDFQGKAEILEYFGQERAALKARWAQLERAIEDKSDILAQAKLKLTVLENVTPAAYRRALLGDVQAAERVAAHTLGIFPEWEDAPEWFDQLTANSERDSNGI